MIQSIELRIEGMHCAACVRRVTAALTRLQGVAVGRVEVGSAQVMFDPVAASIPRITSALENAGFTAKAETAVR